MDGKGAHVAEGPVQDVGGDEVCWLDRVCPECGGLDTHRADCEQA